MVVTVVTMVCQEHLVVVAAALAQAAQPQQAMQVAMEVVHTAEVVVEQAVQAAIPPQ